MKKILSLFAAVLFAGSMMAATEMTCAQAAEAAKGGSTEEVVVLGYVTEIATVWSSQYKNISFWMADEGNGGKVLQAFRCVAETEEEAPEVGDLVKVTGTLSLYNTTPELAAGCTFEMIQKGAVTPPAEDADVVFGMTDFAGLGTAQTGSEVTVEKDGVTFWCDKAYGTESAGVRCYKDGNVKISSAEKQIGKLVFEFDQDKTGGLGEEVVVNALVWEYALTESQARFKKIKVYFGEAEPIEPEELDTISAAEAKARCEALEVGSTEKVAVLCLVASIKDAYNEQYGNVTVWLNDDPESTYGDIQAYRAKCSAEDGAALAEHDRVLVVGNLSHSTYEKDGETKHSYQIAAGAQLTRLGAQGIENIELTKDVQKVMVDGVMYIVRDGKMFNVQGAQVR